MEKRIKIISINETEYVGQTQFAKRTVEAETVENYPQTLLFEFHHDNVSIPDAFKVKDELTISFDIRGKKVIKENQKPMFFTTLVAWNLKRS